ncbi:23889_t:CDS:2, partial [Racocetra persica]
ADTLVSRAIDSGYRRRLGRAQLLFESSCDWIEEMACLAGVDIEGFANPVEDFRIKEMLRWYCDDPSENVDPVRGCAEEVKDDADKVRLLERYLIVWPYTINDMPLFLVKRDGKMSVSAVSSVIKRMADHVKLR